MPNDDAAPDGRFNATPEPSPFRHLVGLKVEQKANRIDTQVPLRLTLTADSHVLEVAPPTGNPLQRMRAWLKNTPMPPIKLLIRLRSVYVRYTLTDCEIPEATRYKRIINEGNYASSATTQTKTNVETGLSGRASVSFGASLVSLTAKAEAGGVASAEHQTRETQTEKQTHAVEVASVLPVVEGWRIGDSDLGDPTKADGCLTGQYLAEPGEPDTCNLVMSAATARARFEVTVRDTGIHVSRPDRANANLSEQDAALAAMRNRLAALRMEKALSSPATDRDGELLLCAVDCLLERAPDLPDLPIFSPLPPELDRVPRRRRKPS